MKINEHPLFLMASLSLFFPIGLVLLILTDHPARRKIIMAVSGGILFLMLLATTFFGIPKAEEYGELEVVITKDQLTVGQSGGFTVQRGKKIVGDFKARASNGNLQINDNIYTALKEGSTTVTVQAQGLEETFEINVIPGIATDSTVYLSPTGERYHKTDSHAGHNAITMTEEEALRSGKTPCKICYK